jgi:hypothetical protein
MCPKRNSYFIIYLRVGLNREGGVRLNQLALYHSVLCQLVSDVREIRENGFKFETRRSPLPLPAASLYAVSRNWTRRSGADARLIGLMLYIRVYACVN